jgi:hypothetical protein
MNSPMAAATAFRSSMHTALPDLVKVSGAADWLGHMKTKIPGTPYSVQDVVTQAYQQGDWNTVNHHIQAVIARRAAPAAPAAAPAGGPGRQLPQAAAPTAGAAAAQNVSPDRFLSLADAARGGRVSPARYHEEMEAWSNALFSVPADAPGLARH